MLFKLNCHVRSSGEHLFIHVQVLNHMGMNQLQ